MRFIPRIQGFFYTCKSTYAIHYINKMKNVNSMIISVDAEKVFDKIQHPFVKKKKNLLKGDIEGIYLNIIKAIHDKPTANIILSGKKPGNISSNQDQDKDVYSHHYYSTSLEVLDMAIREEEKKKKVESRLEKEPREEKRKKKKNKESRLSLFADDMILNIENPKDATRKILELINELDKVSGYNINAKNSLAFLYTNSKRLER